MKIAILSGEAFNRLIDSVKAFTSKTDYRPALKLIQICFYANTVKAVSYAVDGYRAAKKTFLFSFPHPLSRQKKMNGLRS